MLGDWDVNFFLYSYCVYVFNQFFRGYFIIYFDLSILIYHSSFIYYLSYLIFCVWLVMKTNVESDALSCASVHPTGFVIK